MVKHTLLLVSFVLSCAPLMVQAQSFETSACASVCNAASLHLTEVPSSSSFFCAAKDINVSGAIQTTEETIFKAGKRIIFKPGFKAPKGSRIFAYTEDCTQSRNQYIGNDGFDYANNETFGVPSFSISPNPVQYESKLQLALPNPREVSIIISTINGRIIHTPISRKRLEQGQHQYTLSGDDFPHAGMYFVTLQTNDETYTQRMLVVR